MRLDGWKAIASHLGRGCRTVQRWHLLYRMPVHHVGGRGGVFAYSDEIDKWFRHHDQGLEQQSPNGAKGLLIEMPGGTPMHNREEQSSLSKFALESLAERRIEEGYEMWSLLSSKNLSSIARTFREAIDLDPQNPEAYAGLSHTLIAQGLIGKLTLAAAYSSARTAVEAALRLDLDSAEALSGRAWIKMALDRDWEGARQIFDGLLNRNPVSTRVMVGRALLYIADGNLEPASDLLYAASERARLSSLSLGLHSWSEYLAGNYIEVMAHIAETHASGRSGPIFAAVEALTSIQVERASSSVSHIEMLLDQDPRNDVVRGALGYMVGRSGDRARAQATIEYLTKCRSHARDTSHYAIGLTFLGLGQKEEATRSILLSFEEGSLWSLGFRLDPILGLLEQETEFRDFISAAYPQGAPAEQALPLPIYSS